MPSSQKTPLGLNQWQPDDIPDFDDHSADNLITDTALASKFGPSIPGATNWDSGNSLFLKSSTGYHRFPNGFTIQWGLIIVDPAAWGTVTFPLAFTDVFQPTVSGYGGSLIYTTSNNLTTTSMQVAHSHSTASRGIRWRVEGYIS